LSRCLLCPLLTFFFCFHDPAPPEIYTLSLHDALPIFASAVDLVRFAVAFDRPDRCPLFSAEHVSTMFERPPGLAGHEADGSPKEDRKSTRLNSSHVKISYAVFCLKKKKRNTI